MTRGRPRSERPEQILAALTKAGTLGLNVAEVQAALSINSLSTASVRMHLASLVEAGQAYCLKLHPALVYYAASVPRKAAESGFSQRAGRLFASRAAKRNEALGWTAQPKRLGTPARRRELPAVDPQGLRRDATVTVPTSVQVQTCPAGQDMRRRADPNHRGEFSRLPIGQYPEPGSSWAQAATEQRRSASEGAPC